MSTCQPMESLLTLDKSNSGMQRGPFRFDAAGYQSTQETITLISPDGSYTEKETEASKASNSAAQAAASSLTSLQNATVAAQILPTHTQTKQEVLTAIAYATPVNGPRPTFFHPVLMNPLTYDAMQNQQTLSYQYPDLFTGTPPGMHKSAMLTQPGMFPMYGNPYANPLYHKFMTPSLATPQPTLPPSHSNDIQSIAQRTDKPQVFYRNLFHTIHGKFLHDGSNWEGCRVYIHDNVGYSGNAKRFKRRPEKGEKALILECTVLDPKDQLVSQTCLACRDYFDTQKYFKTNQECVGKIMLVKNNSPISVENGQFKILVKMMCCCIHHSVDYFLFELNLISTLTNRKVYSAKIPLNVKQWRKSNQKKEECVLLLE